MERERSWETITAIGSGIKERWRQLAGRHRIEIDLWGLPALAGFTIRSPNALAYKTLITQELLARGYLAGNCIYASTAHSPEILDGYFEALDAVFELIRQCEQGLDVTRLLKGPVCHAGFKRLN
jgi:glutamate-1-semialdehyde 2,1-aminomutase